MKHLYMIRHGNHNWHELTDHGIAQVVDLFENQINARLSPDRKYKIIASPAERTMDTAATFRKVIQENLGISIDIKPENAFGQFKGSGSYTGSLEYGEAVIPLIEGYFKESDIVLLAGHKECIGSLCLALPKHYDIPYSDTLKPHIWPPDDEECIRSVMRSTGGDRERAIQKMIEYYPDGFIFPTKIREAQAAFFDLEEKTCELIDHGLRTFG